MERMNIDDKLIRLTTKLYNNLEFYVEMDGRSSAWKKQATGIRQGCTLSPYLFSIIMTVIFADVHADPELKKELDRNRPPETEIDEVLYADDTIILSTDNMTLEKFLQKIEECAEPYGLKLNHAKCEIICTDPAHSKTIKVKNRNKKMIKVRKEAKYLGCKLNFESNIRKEL